MSSDPRSMVQTSFPCQPGWLMCVVSLCAIAVVLLVVVAKAWICDDAYITFRTVDNFQQGYGLTWNVDERVQAFTHPLWLFVVSAASAYTGEVYFSTITVSVFLTLSSLILFQVRIASSSLVGVLGLLVFALSRAFTDYCTSGLENPLLYLLFAVFFVCVMFDRGTLRSVVILSVTASLIAITRLDMLVIVCPVLAASIYMSWCGRVAASVMLGFAPLIVWEIFSLFYYGFPFPNTAYAKLGTGFARIDVLHQGLMYFRDSLQRDPVTLATILSAIIVAVRADGRSSGLGIGVLGYLAYVAWIGGDFMSGRFLSVPFFVSVLILVRLAGQCRRRVFAGTVACLLMAFGVLLSVHQLVFGDIPVVDGHGIADERKAYAGDLGLLAVLVDGSVGPSTTDTAQRGLELRQLGRPALELAGRVGLLGYYAGPSVHVLDVNALGDPLLARLPAERGSRVGHFVRRAPPGYLESLQIGENRILNDDLFVYYENLRVIVRGELFDRYRLRQVILFNLGRDRKFLEGYLTDYGDYHREPMRSSRSDL